MEWAMDERRQLPVELLMFCTVTPCDMGLRRSSMHPLHVRWKDRPISHFQNALRNAFPACGSVLVLLSQRIVQILQSLLWHLCKCPARRCHCRKSRNRMLACLPYSLAITGQTSLVIVGRGGSEPHRNSKACGPICREKYFWKLLSVSIHVRMLADDSCIKYLDPWNTVSVNVQTQWHPVWGKANNMTQHRSRVSMSVAASQSLSQNCMQIKAHKLSWMHGENMKGAGNVTYWERVARPEALNWRLEYRMNQAS